MQVPIVVPIPIPTTIQEDPNCTAAHPQKSWRKRRARMAYTAAAASFSLSLSLSLYPLLTIMALDTECLFVNAFQSTNSGRLALHKAYGPPRHVNGVIGPKPSSLSSLSRPSRSTLVSTFITRSMVKEQQQQQQGGGGFGSGGGGDIGDFHVNGSILNSTEVTFPSTYADELQQDHTSHRATHSDEEEVEDDDDDEDDDYEEEENSSSFDSNDQEDYNNNNHEPSSPSNQNQNQNILELEILEKESPTAPEVNQWTTIMSAAPDAVFAPHSTVQESQLAMESLYHELSNMSTHDKEQVEMYWDQMMPSVSYLGTHYSARVKEALRVAYCAHRGQARKSGEPFIIHPVEVAKLLAELKMDAETVMAGLLHDTVEDTDLTFEQVEAMFGHVVKSIVEGETKVSKLPKLAYEDFADEQAENLRQMFVAMTDDYRIIIVKLADRLHNMRTLRHMKPHKQIKISRETLDIFAPLAHRMGIWQFKSELEDTSFKYLYPLEYKRLNRRLRRHQTKFYETLDISKDILKKTLDKDQTLKDQAKNVKVDGRTKELYSLWHKMETRGEHNLDHISDVVALRVIIEPKNLEGYEESTDKGVWLCYHVLGLVQHLPGFQPVPKKVKDYISFPKPNGYQSLHTAVMLNGQTIEVQIRTSAMHQIAEHGMASHWAYTDTSRHSIDIDYYNTPWLSSIKEWQDEVVCSRDFVDCVRRELLGKRVFVFLRNGKILNLSKGSTVIDAAFQIHTEVGLTMHGVEINGKPESLSYELNNGDVVSVLTGNGKPATDWMRFAKIRSTRSKLRSYFRKKQRESLREAGWILLMDFLDVYGDLMKKNSYIEKPFVVPNTAEEIASFLPGNSNYEYVDDLLHDIGNNHDRDFLYTTLSKIFLVPRKLLVEAESSRREHLSAQVLSIVNAKRQSAIMAGSVLDTEDAVYDNENIVGRAPMGEKSKAEGSRIIPNGAKGQKNEDTGEYEYADPEYLCPSCLPVLGDDIIGVRKEGSDCFGTIVHRCGCPIAQSAINESQSDIHVNDDDVSINNVSTTKAKTSSSMTSRLRVRSGQNEAKDDSEESIIKLKWDESAYMANGEKILYLAQVTLIAEDRKLLLADCSEVVSDMSEIVKTGSVTTNEHAKLQFLVKVESIDHLQNLMDNLTEIDSVMSVERKFGSSL